MARKKALNLILLGIDSLRADHMSGYGYHRLTTPHIDRLASQGVLFERTFSPHIPTTSAYASMLTGLDCFSTNVVALRHKGGLPDDVSTLPEILSRQGYDTSCVGFSGNASSRGFDTYLDYASWGSWEEGRSPKADSLNTVAIPELERLAAGDTPHLGPRAEPNCTLGSSARDRQPRTRQSCCPHFQRSLGPPTLLPAGGGGG